MDRANLPDQGCPCEMCVAQLDVRGVALTVHKFAKLIVDAKCLAGDIHTSYEQLESIWRKHGSIIAKRWHKKYKSKAKPREMIEKACKDVPLRVCLRHREYFQLLQDREAGDRTTLDRDATDFLHPYINLEDLTSDHSTLVRWLSARCTGKPHTFIWLDMFLANIVVAGHDPEGRLMPFAMLLSDQRYGEVLLSSDLPDNELAFNLPIGLAVLEIQSRVYKTLLNIVSGILHDYKLDSATLASMTDEDVLARLDDLELNAWPSFAETVAELPFATPPSLDIDRLITTAQARSSAALDHLTKPWESAPYVTRCLRDWNSHWSSIQLKRYSYNPVQLNKEKQKQWGRITGRWAAEAFFNAENWSMIVERLEDIRSEMPTSRAQSLMSCDLALQVQILSHTLMNMLSHALDCLNFGIPSSQEMQRACSPTLEALGKERLLVSVDDVVLERSASPEQKEVFTLFRWLCNEQKRNAIGLYLLVAEIQLRLDEDPAFAQCLSSWNVERFSDVAYIVEIMTRSRLWQPYATIAQTFAAQAKDKTRDLYSRNVETGKRILLYCASHPLDPAPPDLKEGSDTWQEGIPLPPIFKSLLQNLHFLKLPACLRSPPVLTDDPDEPSDEEASDEEPDADNTYLSNISSDRAPEASSSESAPDLLALKVGDLSIDAGPVIKNRKKKTRGQADPARATPAEAGAPEPPQDVPQSIIVDARSLETFRDLFDKKRIDSIVWVDFCRAMVAVDFSAKKQGGVNWLFTHQHRDNISFHAPHGKNGAVMENQKRRDIAGDLERKYGWSAETFVMA